MLTVGVWVKVRVSFRVGGYQTSATKKIAPRLGLEFRLELILGLGAIFFWDTCPNYADFKGCVYWREVPKRKRHLEGCF